MTDTELFDAFQDAFGSVVPAKDKRFVLYQLKKAGNDICDLIGRDFVPDRLFDIQVELAVIAYNKRGAEGEASRSEGGISRTFQDLPPMMLARLKNYPRKVGVIRAVNAERPSTDSGAESQS